MSAGGSLRRWAGALRTELAALRIAAGDPRVSRASRWLVVAAVAYAASPVDLIPDFIPVLGHLDDLLLVPAMLWLALRMIPPDVLDDCRRRAAERAR